jgi:hypothetical protein
MYHRMVDATEMRAACKAIIRHELGLRHGADAVAELAARLEPDDRSHRPPTRAPAAKRLRAVLRTLQAGGAPSVDLDQLSDDLRFLRLFEARPLDDDALDALLRDVAADEPAKRNAPVRRIRRKRA